VIKSNSPTANIEIQKLIGELTRATEVLITEALELSYFSRGAWSYDAVLNMSAKERELGAEFIKKRLESAAKSAHPVY
jgi:hypothetical protein